MKTRNLQTAKAKQKVVRWFYQDLRNYNSRRLALKSNIYGGNNGN